LIHLFVRRVRFSVQLEPAAEPLQSVPLVKFLAVEFLGVTSIPGASLILSAALSVAL
jgi:hypothetical protein